MKDNFTMKSEEENLTNLHKDMQTIKLPLAPQQVNMIKKTLTEGYTFDEALKIIKSTINSTEPEKLYKTVFENLEPLFQEKTKTIVGMLFLYKKKMCRNGNSCLNKDKCIFLHENEIQTKRLSTEESTRKRFKQDNNEVVFNKVPVKLANESFIENYASNFGSVSSIKKLNEGKYLIIFDDSDSAQSLISSKDPVMGDSNITKFFNVILNAKQNELNIDEIFEEQNNLLNMGPMVLSDVKNFNRLKYLSKKIKEYFDSNLDKKKKIESNDNDYNINKGFSSFYAEHFK